MSKDPFTEPMIVECNMFNQFRMCTVVGTKEAKENPRLMYNRDEILYIERPEDLYGSRHYAGRNAVRLTKDSWKKAYI